MRSGWVSRMVGQPTGRGDQRFLAARRERQHDWLLRCAVVLSRGEDGGSPRLGEYDMGVRATESERIHPDYPSLAVGKTARPVARYVELKVREG